MVLYSKFAYESQFSGEKKELKIRYLVPEILSKNPGTPCMSCPNFITGNQDKISRQVSILVLGQTSWGCVQLGSRGGIGLRGGLGGWERSIP